MKISRAAILFGSLLLGGCSTSHPPAAPPETVTITYRVLPGKEQELQNILSTAWNTYQHEHMVHSQPHVLVQMKEEDGKSHFVEVFTWNNAGVPDDAPDSVQKLWGQMMELCEKRDGHEGLEIAPVDLIVPSASE